MKRIIHFFEYVVFRMGMMLVAILPKKVLLGISSLIAWLLEKVIGYRKKVIHKNLLNSFPHMIKEERAQIASQFYSHLTDLLFETLRAFHLNKDQLQTEFTYQKKDVLTPCLLKNQSIILMGSHYGNWEVGCLSFPLQVSYPVYTVYKPLSNPFIDKYLKETRSKWGMNMIPMNKLGRVIVEKKDEPAIYIFVADQSPATTINAVWKTFLHQQTPFINGVEKIAKKTNYPVFYFHIHKTKRMEYKVEFSALKTEDSLEYGKLTDLYLTQLTNQIEKEPSHWLWSHNRWKRANERTSN